METLTYSLIIETLKFVELCQLYLSSGRIQLNEYYNLTCKKFKFINETLMDDMVLFQNDKDITEELDKIILKHNVICHSLK